MTVRGKGKHVRKVVAKKDSEETPELTPPNEDAPVEEPEIEKVVDPTQEDAEQPEGNPASDGASEGESSSVDASTTETPVVVPTALNPDTWPSKTEGTVTDPEILRRHGLEPVVTTNTATYTSGYIQSAGGVAEAPIPEQPSPAHELFLCLHKQLPSGHAKFWSDAHIRGERLACPTCNATTIRRA